MSSWSHAELKQARERSKCGLRIHAALATSAACGPSRGRVTKCSTAKPAARNLQPRLSGALQGQGQCSGHSTHARAALAQDAACARSQLLGRLALRRPRQQERTPVPTLMPGKAVSKSHACRGAAGQPAPRRMVQLLHRDRTLLQQKHQLRMGPDAVGGRHPTLATRPPYRLLPSAASSATLTSCSDGIAAHTTMHPRLDMQSRQSPGLHSLVAHRPAAL